MSQYKAVIDIEASKIYFKLNEFTSSAKSLDESKVKNYDKNINESEKENQNFLQILSHSYDFPDEITKSKTKQNKKEFAEYFGAINLYSKKINKKENQKIHSVLSIDKMKSTSSNQYSLKQISPTSQTSMDISKNLTFEEFIKTDDLMSQYDFPEDYLKRVIFIANKLNLDHCTIQERKIIWTIVACFPLQFYVDGDILSSTDVIKHEIKFLPGSNVVNLRQYRIPHTHKQILEDIVRDHEQQGIIEKCQSNYNSPAILVSKKDDKGEYTDFRLVIDYRKLNEITEATKFPIPLIDDILDGLNGCSFFTTQMTDL